MNSRILLALLVITGTVFAASSFVLAIDGSGSMNANRINGSTRFEVARDAAICMVDSMREGDEGAIFVFEDSHTITLVKGFTTNKNSLKSALRGMDSEFGATDLKGGINLSSSYALANASNGNKFVIVLSDGGAASAALNQTAAYFHNNGISSISVVGLGVKDNVSAGKTLAGIADNGGGKFYSTFDYLSPCDAFRASYNDGIGNERSGFCPLFLVLPLFAAAGLACRWHG